MSNFYVDLGDWKQFKNKLDKLTGDGRIDAMRDAGEIAGIVMDEAARKTLPPTPRKLKASRWWTLRQKRWWWATMNAKAKGKSNALPGWRAWYDEAGDLQIEGSYKRTGKLVQSLTYDVETHFDGVRVRYGTNRTYARYVIDDELQSRYHKGNWRTLQYIARANLRDISEAFTKRLMYNIRKALQ